MVGVIGKQGILKRNKFADMGGRTLETSYLLSTADHVVLRSPLLDGFYKLDSLSISSAPQDPPDNKGDRKPIS